MGDGKRWAYFGENLTCSDHVNWACLFYGYEILHNGLEAIEDNYLNSNN